MTAYECRIADTPAAALALRHLDALGTIAADHLAVAGGEFRLVLTDSEIAAVEAAGLTVARGEPLATRDQRDDAGVPAGPLTDLLTGFVTGYLDGPQVDAALGTLAAAHPSLCTVINLPVPTVGYDGSLASALGPATVRMLRITTDPTTRSRPGLLIFGGTHAREWMNPLIALEFAGQLLANYDPSSTDPATQAVTAVVAGADILIIPVLNPDGLTFSVHDDAGWRKNRRPNAGSPGCPGVDNNRNYEVYFGGAGSSGAPCSESYRGAAAFSENENLNLRWVLEEFPNVLVGVDLHSYGQQLLRPGPGGGSFIASLPVSAADHAVYTSLETTLGNAITAVNGAVYSTGSTSNHAGTSDEYMFFAHRVFGFNTECGTSFQPAWASAVPVINEVVAGLHALASATVGLTVTTPTPLTVVQCLDRTGSMISFGYDGPARANAKRFTDLLSVGDSTAVVSFADPNPDPTATPVADRAQVEVPMTVLNDPGDAATVRAGIDGITFGGWTPIGAGLLKAAGLLTGSTPPTAVLLISDGYQNRDPSVASVLPMLPAGLRVFTVALGPAADAALLQQIATDTGGTFLLSPTALDLHQVYNEMRAGITDEGLVINTLLGAEAESDQPIDVEPAADRLTVTVSADDAKLGRVRLIAPSGRVVRPDDFGVRAVAGDGYRVVAVDRPAPGRWRVRVERRSGACVVAAFVRSPLRLRLELPRLVTKEQAVELKARARFDRVRLADLRLTVRSEHLPLLPADLDRDLDRDAKRLSLRGQPAWGPVVGWPAGRGSGLPPGFSRVRIEVEGLLPGGAPFRRTALRSVRSV